MTIVFIFKQVFITLYFWTSMLNIVTFCYDLRLNDHYVHFQTSFMSFYYWMSMLDIIMIYKWTTIVFIFKQVL